jgi:Fic family protein
MGVVMADFTMPIKEATLKYWHTILFSGDDTLRSIGDYRLGPDPMRIISGPLTNPVIHYEAPPAHKLEFEMKRFVPSLEKSYSEDRLISGILSSGIAHLYFESIHPFEDGNGRIGRALIDHMLSQTLGVPVPFSISQGLQLRQKEYYAELGGARKNLDATSWMVFYLEVLSEAIALAQSQIKFVLRKAAIFDEFDDAINDNQRKVLMKLFDAGVAGFDGGLSAKNYMSITRTSRATTTRELTALTELGLLNRIGAGRGTRYELRFEGMN